VENFIHTKYGFCYYAIESDSAIIFNLYVESEHRRKGHARKLLQQVIREIRETGYYKDIQIEIAPRENSIPTDVLASFYQTAGLKVIA